MSVSAKSDVPSFVFASFVANAVVLVKYEFLYACSFDTALADVGLYISTSVLYTAKYHVLAAGALAVSTVVFMFAMLDGAVAAVVLVDNCTPI